MRSSIRKSPKCQILTDIDLTIDVCILPSFKYVCFKKKVTKVNALKQSGFFVTEINFSVIGSHTQYMFLKQRQFLYLFSRLKHSSFKWKPEMERIYYEINGKIPPNKLLTKALLGSSGCFFAWFTFTWSKNSKTLWRGCFKHF